MSFVRRLHEDLTALSVMGFNEQAVNGLPHANQIAYLQKLNSALNNYISWMNDNAARPVYLGRCSHFRHGESGKERAVKLKKLLRDETQPFFEIVKQTGEAVLASANTQHSFKRYYFQAMTGILVINRVPFAMEDSDFFNLFQQQLTDEFLTKAGHTAKDFSYLALTEGVRVYLQRSLAEEFDSERDLAIADYRA
jgi:hypothetical protein